MCTSAYSVPLHAYICQLSSNGCTCLRSGACLLLSQSLTQKRSRLHDPSPAAPLALSAPPPQGLLLAISKT